MESVCVCVCVCVCVQKGIYRNEIKKATDKAAGIDVIIAEMLRYGGETMVEWMCLMCYLP